MTPDKYSFGKLKDTRDFRFGEKFLRIFAPVDRNTLDPSITEHFERLLALPYIGPFAVLLPDFHPGAGNVIGSVIPTRDMVLINEIGGDIGCDMLFLPLMIYEDEIRSSLQGIYAALNREIPVGTRSNVHVNERVQNLPLLEKEFRAGFSSNTFMKTTRQQIGSLGGGNHFLEIQIDEYGEAGIMIHTGSRNLGVKVRDYYLDRFRNSALARDNKKVPRLALDDSDGQDYLHDMELVVNYSFENRMEILRRVLEVIDSQVPLTDKVRQSHHGLINIPHNFARIEEHFGENFVIHRKGATSAQAGEDGIIPGSMGTKSFIVEGTGCSDSLKSCSHGAGRAISRHDARRKITDKEFTRTMKGVLADTSRKKKDEAPAAYKKIEEVIRNQSRCIKVRRHLRPLAVIKG